MSRVGSRGESRRFRVVAAGFAVTVIGGLALASGAGGVGPADALPDLVSDAPTGELLQTYVDADSGQRRLLLRFNGYVHNQGTGPLEIVGRSPVSGTMTASAQRIYNTSGAVVREDTSRNPVTIYETADGHNHWHLRAAMRYALYDANKSFEVAPSQKVGFCLIDSERIEATGPEAKAYLLGSFCEKNKPTVASVTMGISSGWRDVYGSGVAFQWVDVSDVKPGTYWLAASSDPTNSVLESNENNNGAAFAAAASVIPGFVARPVSVSNVTAAPKQVSLDAQTFGEAGARMFKIVTAPAHGTLDQGVGQAFAGPEVTYTPLGGYSGSDSFTYVAVDANSEFPRTPTAAAVTLTVSPTVPTVSISGAPASMLTGTSVQLTATVTGDPPSVQWRVNGVLGGTTETGRVTTAGLYSAPATPPPGGNVTIRATSARAQSEITIRIDPQPAPVPAPVPDTDTHTDTHTHTAPHRHPHPHRHRHRHPHPALDTDTDVRPGEAVDQRPAAAAERRLAQAPSPARRPDPRTARQRPRDRRLERQGRHGRDQRLEGVEPHRALPHQDAGVALVDLPDPDARRLAGQRDPRHGAIARQREGDRSSARHLLAADRLSAKPRRLPGDRSAVLALRDRQLTLRPGLR